jgi:hypothetical protein
MANKKILHILFPEKFFSGFIALVNENFDPDRHLFLYLKTKGSEPNAANVKSLRYYRWGILYYIEMLRYARQADKIILHSLSKTKVLYFLFFFPRFASKSYWFLWGGDLFYRLEKYSKPFHNPIAKYVFKSVVQKLAAIVTHIKGDCELAKKELGFSGKYFDCFLYPSNIFVPQAQEPLSDKSLWIMVGNSSHPSNNHADAFERLSYLRNSDIKIICPLSYGKKRNREKVLKLGYSIFGDKFLPITKFMPLSEYNELLSKVRVAIFNHWRQQALGNIITLIGLGKTVYIRREITTWDTITSMGIKILDFSTMQTLNELSEAEKRANTSIVQNHFTAQKLSNQLRVVFDA